MPFLPQMVLGRAGSSPALARRDSAPGKITQEMSDQVMWGRHRGAASDAPALPGTALPQRSGFSLAGAQVSRK